MRTTTILLAGLAGFSAAAAAGQLVPEGIHSYARGPAEMCGLVGRDAADLIEKARSSPDLRQRPIESGRFELFVSGDGMSQLVVTRAGEEAHPAATCRHIYQDDSGNWVQNRTMRCDASREACDRLFVEFRQLDGQLRESLMGER